MVKWPSNTTITNILRAHAFPIMHELHAIRLHFHHISIFIVVSLHINQMLLDAFVCRDFTKSFSCTTSFWIQNMHLIPFFVCYVFPIAHIIVGMEYIPIFYIWPLFIIKGPFINSICFLTFSFQEFYGPYVLIHYISQLF